MYETLYGMCRVDMSAGCSSRPMTVVIQFQCKIWFYKVDFLRQSILVPLKLGSVLERLNGPRRRHTPATNPLVASAKATHPSNFPPTVAFL